METPKEMRMKIVGRASEDADFRTRLLSDPKGAVEEELSVSIPASMSIEVHEDDGTTVHLVLPPDSKLGEGDLQAVAGGVADITLGGLATPTGPSIMDDW